MAAARSPSELTASELMSELQSFGLKTGPITPTTRRILERRLERARNEKNAPSPPVVEPDTSAKFELPAQEGHAAISSSFPQEFDSSDGTPDLFYGVCFDDENHPNGCKSPAVFVDKTQALQAVKSLKNYGARFKAFKSKSDAEQFSLPFNQSQRATPNTETKSPDPISNFKSPTPQQLVLFRKLIEQGKQQEFIELVYNNPRYLISSGDTPVILQEGFRYNAMHVASKENRPHMCELIIRTLESIHFWQVFLQTDNKDSLNSSVNNNRRQFLVDLYLNTPDKGNLETPLHFACKFGHLDVVKYLVSHPLTSITPHNRYGDTPEEMACSRCSSLAGSVQKKDQIKHLLQDNYFVPVFGSQDNSTPPILGDPWSPTMAQGQRRPPSCSSVGVYSPRESVRAYAGPMSPSKASEFHRMWKTPPTSPEDRKQYTNIRRGDSSRGIERIGRSLAHSHGVPWAEYWDFLGCYVDLATPDGLDKLEAHLEKRKRLMTSSHSYSSKDSEDGVPSTPDQSRSSEFTHVFDSPLTTRVPSGRSSGKKPFPIGDVTDELSPTDEKTPSDLATEDLISGLSGLSISSYDTSPEQPMTPLSIQTDFNKASRLDDTKDSTDCKKKLFQNKFSPEGIHTDDVLSGGSCNVISQKADELSEQMAHIVTTEGVLVDEPSSETHSRCWEDGGLGHLDPHASLGSRSTGHNTPRLRQLHKNNVFIDGLFPSKLDVDVLRAIENSNVDERKYPLLTLWRESVMAYSAKARESWPSPGSPRFRLRHKKVQLWSC
ncbi:ankyrin repeat and LEM domain-containing protein 2 isoform X2 [Nematostella vectensis]|uniref:ankyrin repeat and LEM domain-containing protein 2 isoform X2 n=1 Tax=Nematostella vectensis TaxID=45351 RepID=UPI00138FDBA1|nr:ankyrin repeat and LEM domain-containing protein 2 isoform X2 [Nematostella vectensis]